MRVLVACEFSATVRDAFHSRVSPDHEITDEQIRELLNESRRSLRIIFTAMGRAKYHMQREAARGVPTFSAFAMLCYYVRLELKNAKEHGFAKVPEANTPCRI